MRRLYLTALLVFVFPSTAHAQPVEAVDAFGLDVFAPVELVGAPGQGDRVYVVEQGVAGPRAPRVRTFVPGDAEASTVLDLSDRVVAGGERGLLGLAFHPDYAANGRVFVSYTAPDPLRSVVSEFAQSTTDPLAADPASEAVILEVPQPLANHNGGQIAFGPDGFLYIGLGDGGGAGDPEDNGGDPTTLLGSILRIDVDAVPDGETYGIPLSNPFAATDGLERDEIYAYGFRNPWRFAFDGSDLWAMDVGQDAWEEINRVEAGTDYGWNRVEGPACFRSGCDPSTSEPPVFAYAHDGATGGFSVSGGLVYRGADLPGLDGHVLYADYVTRRIWSLDVSRSAPDSTHLATIPRGTNNAGISAVRAGPDGEAYVLVHSFNGATRILRLTPTPLATPDGPDDTPRLEVTGPNPFSDATTVTAVRPDGGEVRVTLHDALGREVRTLFEGALAPDVAQTVRIEGRGLAPGLYAVQVAAGSAVEVRTLVRVR